MAKQFAAVPSPPSATGADMPLANKDDIEISQEMAEQIYEEIMSK